MTLVTKIKCSNCGLHYAVYSWEDRTDSWADEYDGGYCPECGIKGAKIVWAEKIPQQIFEVIPGGTDMVGMYGVKEDTAPFGHGSAALTTETVVRGPYGTNKGDQWLAPDSEVQRELDAEGRGFVLVHWIDDNGEEALYTTREPEMIAQAQADHEKWVAAQAERN